MAPAPALLIVVLLAPGLIAYMAERTPQKSVSEPMLVLGAATVFGPLRLLWEQGMTIEAALEILGDPARMALSWSAAAATWLLGQLGLLCAKQFTDIAARHTMAELNEERAKLIAEWGPANANKPAA